MFPFQNTWPYEAMGDDLYVTECPMCGERNVLLPISKLDLVAIREGKKRLLVFPCCKGSVKIVDADADYLLANRKLR